MKVKGKLNFETQHFTPLRLNKNTLEYPPEEFEAPHFSRLKQKARILFSSQLIIFFFRVQLFLFLLLQ